MASSAKPVKEIPVSDFEERWTDLLIGQPEVIKQVTPYIDTHRAKLNPDGRPAGVFLLLGPTGSGKTWTVETLAKLLHGDFKKHIRIDCGEFQMEHEVAKLIGAPPGYLGHRETIALLNQNRINSVISENSSLSLLLFDEIEKGAPSLERLLLGILDKGTLRLGDNTTVNFQDSMIFLTSNLGSKTMSKALIPDFGFESITGSSIETLSPQKLKSIGMKALKKKFSSEFVNRIDGVIAYNPLTHDICELIFENIIADANLLVYERLGMKGFSIRVTDEAKQHLLAQGVSKEFGARELKRVIQRKVLHPAAALFARDRLLPSSMLIVNFNKNTNSIELLIRATAKMKDVE